jgi:DNA-binding NarL/FixJ family response regulator
VAVCFDRNTGVVGLAIVLTMEHDLAFVRKAYDARASGYVLKEAAAKENVGAIWGPAERAARELPPARCPRPDR